MSCLIRIYLGNMYCIHRNKNQQIIWHLVEVKALCSFFYSAKYLQISDSTLYELWPSALGPSCSILSYLNKILILQKCALRLINFAPLKSHVVPLFDLYDVLPLNFLHFKSICIIMHAVFNKKKAPLNISSFVTLASDTHYYNT